MKELYSVLGVPRGASAPDIKKAYRKLAKANHPDQHANDPKALERFKEVSAAYTILSDQKERGRYDRGEIDADGQPKAPPGYGGGSSSGFGGGFSGARPGGGAGASSFEFGGGDPSDLFSELFGRGGGAGGFANGGSARPRPPARGGDVAYKLNVSFEDAASLKPQRISLRNGKTLDLKLPPGFEEGRQVRLGGQGDPGPGGAGDALVTLDTAPHRFFVRDGDDIRLDLPVRLGEAVLGAKVRVPTVDGPVTLSVPAGSTSGRTLRLRARGFTRMDGSRGDQLVKLAVDLPADDTELKAFAENWSGDAERNPRGSLEVD